MELSVREGYLPVRIAFEEGAVLVEDGLAIAPDLRVGGELGDLMRLLVAPSLAGVPLPMGARGRSAVAWSPPAASGSPAGSGCSGGFSP